MASPDIPQHLRHGFSAGIRHNVISAGLDPRSQINSDADSVCDFLYDGLHAFRPVGGGVATVQIILVGLEHGVVAVDGNKPRKAGVALVDVKCAELLPLGGGFVVRQTAHDDDGAFRGDDVVREDRQIQCSRYAVAHGQRGRHKGTVDARRGNNGVILVIDPRLCIKPKPPARRELRPALSTNTHRLTSPSC